MKKTQINKMTTKEVKYWSMIKCRAGVPYFKGKPGVAKTAIMNDIALKQSLSFIDLRLSQMDESDLGMPKLTEMKIGDKIHHVSTRCIPDWALKANQQPTLIDFEELNRCSVAVQNAALGILLERRIGDFQFNSNVYFCATGNLGEEDGTNVEEFDSALNNRLIHVEHDLTMDEWMDWANENGVNKLIISFLKASPEYFYKVEKDSPAYATPRSWTFLSTFLNDDPQNENMLSAVAPSYVGAAASSKLHKFISEFSRVNIDMVLKDFSAVKDKIDAIGISKYTELLEQFKETRFKEMEKITMAEMDNFIAFMKNIREDQAVGFFQYWLINNTRDKGEFTKAEQKCLNEFKHLKEIFIKNI